MAVRGRLRYWPAAALLMAFALGGAMAGFGGGILAVTLGLLVVGPAYLIQQSLRRRRGVVPTGRRLDREADDFFAGVAGRYLQTMRRHRTLKPALAAVEVAALAAVWFLLGRGWVEFVLAGTAITFVISIALSRRRQN